MPKLKVIKKKGLKPIKYHPGGLHESLDVPKDKPIPEGKMKKALEGDYGMKAKKQAMFAKNILTGRK